MAKDPILCEFDRTANLDEIVFKLQKGNWIMCVQTHGPYRPRIDLYKAFSEMLGNLPEEERNRLSRIYYNKEEPGSRFGGITFEYKRGGGFSWTVHPPDPLRTLEDVGSEAGRS